MRIIGFSKKWEKLGQIKFTTFRFTRRDRDWYVGEIVQVVFKPRSKEKEILGVAEIVNKELRKMWNWLPEEEAWKDGFNSVWDMRNWLDAVYGKRWMSEPMNRLTLRWVERI